MATTDIRLERVYQEYVGLRDAQDALMDRIDTYEAALLGLTEMVSRNSERLEVVEARLEVVEQRTNVMDGKLDAIMKHLKVPYKPPAGFVKE